MQEIGTRRNHKIAISYEISQLVKTSVCSNYLMQ